MGLYAADGSTMDAVQLLRRWLTAEHLSATPDAAESSGPPDDSARELRPRERRSTGL